METGQYELAEDLNLKVGNEEKTKLTPAQVEIIAVNVVEVTTKKGKAQKVNFGVQHPSSKDVVIISSVKYEKNNTLPTGGTWFNKDTKGLIQKGSPLAVLMAKAGATTLAEMLNKRLDTVTDEQGYLAFKAY